MYSTTSIEKFEPFGKYVKKSLSKNPNMLRTMIGTGMTLIILLSYAVYSNTVDSEYYEYNTTNEHNSMMLTQESDSLAEWYFTTTDAITWVNFTIDSAPSDSTLIVEAVGTNWSHSPNLGLSDQSYICNEPNSDYSDILDVRLLAAFIIDPLHFCCLAELALTFCTIDPAGVVLPNSPLIQRKCRCVDCFVEGLRKHTVQPTQNGRCNPLQKARVLVRIMPGCLSHT